MNKNIGKKLKESRNAAGLKVPEVSQLLSNAGYTKVSPKTIYSWESDNSQPTPDCFLALCSIYGVQDVMGTFGYKKEKPTTESDELKRQENLFKSLPDDLREDALRYLQYLAEQEDKRK